MSDNFYISLPSNGSSKSFPSNTQSNFTTLLENPIQLNGKYQIALAEISNFSNFTVNLGEVSFKYPFFGDVYENRDEIIKFDFEIENGLDLKNFFSKLNYEIINEFIKKEFLFRQKLAFNTDDYLLEKMQKSNDKKIPSKRTVLNVLKYSNEKFEILDKNDSIFSQLFKNGGGQYDIEKRRFQFENVDFLKAQFILVLIRVPVVEENRSKNYFIDKAYLIKDDDYLLDESSQERAWFPSETNKINIKMFQELKTYKQSYFEEDFILDFSYFSFFCPFVKILLLRVVLAL